MEPCLSSFYELVDEMLDEVTSSEGKNDAISSRKMLQKRYQTVETKMKLTFSVVEHIKTQYSINQTKDSRISDGKLKQVLDALAKMKREFESIERPTLLPETPLRARIPGIPFLSRQLSKVEYSLKSENENEVQRRLLPFPFKPIVAIPLVRSLSTGVPKMRQVGHLESSGVHRSTSSDAEALLSKLKWELELEDHSNMEGIIEWESDENFDKEPRKSI